MHAKAVGSKYIQSATPWLPCRSLDLTDNCLSSLGRLSALSCLTVLRLARNSISSLGGHLSRCSALCTLELAHNKLATLEGLFAAPSFLPDGPEPSDCSCEAVPGRQQVQGPKQHPEHGAHARSEESGGSLQSCCAVKRPSPAGMLTEQQQALAVAVQAGCPHLGSPPQAGSLPGQPGPLGAAALALNVLQELDVDDNELRSLEGLQGCPLLVHLSAAHNRIASFPMTLDCVLLQHLNLSCNRFTQAACQETWCQLVQHM